MAPLDQLIHILNFLAPAFFVGLLLALAGRMFFHGGSMLRSVAVSALVNFVVGVVALAVGVWSSGQDGSMLGYGLMLLAQTSSQWWRSRPA